MLAVVGTPLPQRVMSPVRGGGARFGVLRSAAVVAEAVDSQNQVQAKAKAGRHPDLGCRIPGIGQDQSAVAEIVVADSRNLQVAPILGGTRPNLARLTPLNG